MSIKTVRAVATRFLHSSVPEVLVIKGPWGVGKTYAWDALLKEHCKTTALKSYSYVSLFGVSSIAELRLAILAGSRETKFLSSTTASEVNDDWLSLAGSAGRRLIGSLSRHLPDIPYVKNMSVGIESIARYLIRDMIICLDDLERLAVGKIGTAEVLGLISELKNERKCKVVLILNDAKLGEQGIYDEYREKLIDIELAFNPNVTEAIAIALRDDLSLRADIEKHCVALGVKNIRVLKKIDSLVGLVSDDIGGLHPCVMEQVARTLVLAIWCYYDRGESKPTLQFLRDLDASFSWARHMGQEDRDSKTVAMENLLQRYGVSSFDRLDQALFNVVERGYLEETGLGEAARVRDVQCRNRDLEAAMTNSWGLFHNSFDDNEEEVVSALERQLRLSVGQVHPANVSGITTLLRELEREDLADSLIDFYIESHSKDRSIFDLQRLPFANRIEDKMLRERFLDQLAKVQPSLSLGEAVATLAANSAHSEAAMAALRSASEDDFVAFFKGTKGDELSRYVATCLQFSEWQNEEDIAQKARAALTRIGQESRLNAARVRVLLGLVE